MKLEPRDVSMSLQFLLDIARQKNQTPLPLIKPYSGPRLPPDRYCLTAPNYRLKSLQKKVRIAQGLGIHPWGVGSGVKSLFSAPLKGVGEYWPVYGDLGGFQAGSANCCWLILNGNFKYGKI